jgi:hypothetical protein
MHNAEYRNTAGFESLSKLGAERPLSNREKGEAWLRESGAAVVPNTVPSETYRTLGQASAFAARVMELADRLCGPTPTAAGDETKAYCGNGEFARLRAVMSDTREALDDANEALNRIERELIG